MHALKVVNLRKDLDEREFETKDINIILKNRLRSALLKNKEDPKIILFGISTDLSIALKTMAENCSNILKQCLVSILQQMKESSNVIEEKSRILKQ